MWFATILAVVCRRSEDRVKINVLCLFFKVIRHVFGVAVITTFPRLPVSKGRLPVSKGLSTYVSSQMSTSLYGFDTKKDW